MSCTVPWEDGAMAYQPIPAYLQSSGLYLLHTQNTYNAGMPRSVGLQGPGSTYAS